MDMFDTLINYINGTDVINITRKYHSGEDNINVMPLTNVITQDEADLLHKTFDSSFKTEVETLRSQVQIDMNSPIYESIQDVKEAVNKKLNIDSNYVDARIWHDKEGFYFYPHVDNTKIHVSCQIYLDNNAPVWCGTSYFLNGLDKGDNYVNIFTPPYKTGSGYLLVNTNTEVHGMVHEVPSTCSRTSLYLNFMTN